MTKIKIKKLLMHNFMSFKDEEWDFSNTNRLVLVKGINKDTESPLGNTSNGSGKSTWSHALMYALFGQLDGKFHSSNIKNKYCDSKLNGFKMFVDIEVDTIYSKSDVRHWRIVRGLQSGAAVVLQLFKLNEDDNEWQDISKSSSANTQKFIEDNVTMMNFEMYQRLVMLSVSDKFNFFKFNASQKRDFVETLFDTSVYSRMYKMLVDDMKSKNLVIQNLKANQIKCEKTKEVCEDEIEKYTSSINEQIESVKQEKEAKQGQIDGFDGQFEELAQRQQTIKSMLEKIRENKSKLEDVINKCNDKITNARIEITNCNTTISHHERELNKHKEVLGMICDDCKAVVNKFYSLDVYKEEIDKLNGKIADKQSSIETARAQIEKVKVYDDKLKVEETKQMNELSDSQVQERNLTFQKKQLATSIASLEKKIADLEESITNKSKIPSYSIYQDTLVQIEEVEKELKDETMNLCMLKIGSDMVSPESIKKNIISKVVSSINALINMNLEELSVDFTCTLSSDMNDYEIVTPGGELDLANLSEGENMKLLLSLQLAIRKFFMSRFNVSMNVMIIDEAVDRALDSVSIQKFLGMLLHLSQKESTNISIVSHRVEVEKMFMSMPETQVMVVQKENHISRIMRD